MKLSIILPVYNAEQYIGKCLDSVLGQKFRDFEVILINDGSKDNSASICKAYAQRDKRIVFVDQPNQGVAMARNKGLNLAKGEYIGFVDADDTIESSMYENLFRPTLDNNIAIVIAHYKICNEGSFSIPKTSLPIGRLLNSDQIHQYALQSYYTGGDPLIPALWNKIYKKEFLNECALMFHNQKAVRASDYWFNFEVFQATNSLFVIEESNYCYNNQVTGSIINSFRENQFIGFLETNKKLLNANKKFGFEIDYAKFYNTFNDNTNQHILLAIKKKGFLSAFSLVNKILTNDEFLSSFKYVNLGKKHKQLINSFLKKKMTLPAYLVYGLWSTKISG